MAESFLPPVVAELGANTTGFAAAMAETIQALQEFGATAREVSTAVTEAFSAISIAAVEMEVYVEDAAKTAKAGLRQVAAAARAITKAVDGLGTSAPEAMTAVSTAAEEMSSRVTASLDEAAAAAKTMGGEVRTSMAGIGAASKEATVAVEANAAKTTEAGLAAGIAAGESESALGRMGSAAKGAFGDAAASLQGYTTGLLAVGFGVFEGVKSATAFNAQMTKLSTQAGVSKNQLESLGNGILNLAGQVGFSPTSLAQSLYYVESNFESMGIKSSTALELVKTAAEGARVGGSDLVETTTALNAAVASGIPGVQNMSQAMGALNAIVGSGEMTMEDLVQALGTGVLAVVKGYGLTINDVGASLATFGDNNIRGAVAATDLRMAVQALAVPVKTAGSYLHEFGMTTHTLADDMRKGGLKLALNDLMGHMRKAGITASEQGQVITDMFGKKAGAGLAVLLGNMDRFNSKFPALTKAADGFGNAWQTTQQTAGQAFDSLKSGLEALGVKIGTALMPYLTKFLIWIREGIGWLTEHKSAVTALAVAIGTVLAGAVIALGVAMAAAFGPEEAIALAIIALVEAVVYAYQHFKIFRTVVDDVGRFLSGAFKAAWDVAAEVIHWFAKNVLPEAEKAIKAVFDWFTQHKQTFVNAWHATINAVSAVIHWFATTILPPVEKAIKALFDWFKAHKKDFVDAWHQAVTDVHALVQWFDKNVLTWAKARLKDLTDWWHRNSGEIKQAWDDLVKSVEVIVGALWYGFLKPIIAQIASFWKQHHKEIEDVAKLVWTVISSVISFEMHFILNTISFILDIITGHWGKAFGDLKRLSVQALDDALNAIVRIGSGLGNLLYDAGRNVISGLIRGIESMTGSVSGAMSGVASLIRGFLPFSPAKWGPLSGSGSPDLAGAKIGSMLATGMTRSTFQVAQAGRQLAAATGVSGGAIGMYGAGPMGGSLVDAARSLYGGTGQGPIVNLTVKGSVLSERDLRDVMQREMLRLGMRNSMTWAPYKR